MNSEVTDQSWWSKFHVSIVAFRMQYCYHLLLLARLTVKARVSNSDGAEDVPCAVWRREDLENFTVVDKVGVSKASAISEEIGTLNRDVLHAGQYRRCLKDKVLRVTGSSITAPVSKHTLI